MGISAVPVSCIMWIHPCRICHTPSLSLSNAGRLNISTESRIRHSHFLCVSSFSPSFMSTATTTADITPRKKPIKPEMISDIVSPFQNTSKSDVLRHFMLYNILLRPYRLKHLKTHLACIYGYILKDS